MAKGYSVKTIQNAGRNDAIYDVRVDGGLYITIFTWPNGEREVMIHQCGDYETELRDNDKENNSYTYMFRPKKTP